MDSFNIKIDAHSHSRVIISSHTVKVLGAQLTALDEYDYYVEFALSNAAEMNSIYILKGSLVDGHIIGSVHSGNLDDLSFNTIATSTHQNSNYDPEANSWSRRAKFIGTFIMRECK